MIDMMQQVWETYCEAQMATMYTLLDADNIGFYIISLCPSLELCFRHCHPATFHTILGGTQAMLKEPVHLAAYDVNDGTGVIMWCQNLLDLLSPGSVLTYFSWSHDDRRSVIYFASSFLLLSCSPHHTDTEE